MTTNSIGQRVDYLIHNELKIKQCEFAKTVGLKDSNVSHIIHDERPVSVGLIKKICSAYDVSAEWLLGLRDTQPYSKAEWKEQGVAIGIDQTEIVCKRCGNQPLRDTKFDMLYYSDYCPFCGCYMRNVMVYEGD